MVGDEADPEGRAIREIDAVGPITPIAPVLTRQERRRLARAGKSGAEQTRGSNLVKLARVAFGDAVALQTRRRATPPDEIHRALVAWGSKVRKVLDGGPSAFADALAEFRATPDGAENPHDDATLVNETTAALRRRLVAVFGPSALHPK